MISDKLFELAFSYKKTKLWERLRDTSVFAVRLRNGETGYISIMGSMGEYCALGLYIGEEGFHSFRSILEADPFLLPSFESEEHSMKQCCLHCAFESRGDLSEEERKETKEYARAHGIRLSGKNAYPHFIKYLPYRFPWHLQTDEEQEELCEALAAALEVSGLLKEKTAEELGIVPIGEETEEVPVLVQRDGGYVLEKTRLPGKTEEKWPEPEAVNDINIARLKKIAKSGEWECGIMRLNRPVKEPGEEIPFFPVVFLAVDGADHFILPVSPVVNYEQEPGKLLELFMEALLMQNVCPAIIKVRDERSYAFVKDFCSRMKIELCMEEELPDLYDAQFDLLEYMGVAGDFDEEDESDRLNGMAFMLDRVLEMDNSQLKQLPDELLKPLELLADRGGFPPEIEEKLRKLAEIRNGESAGGSRLVKMDGGKGKAGKDAEASKGAHRTKKALKGSYVISVSLGAGCYRHIRISANDTLLRLHGVIQDAFSFEDDHAYAFFMDNRAWSDRDSYYADGVEPGLRTADRYRLGEVGLCKGKQFKYIFDFGDEWTFQCKVLRETEEDTDMPVIIKSKGEPPSQYPEWDEDDDWDDE